VDIAFSCREGMGTAWVRFEYVAWFRDERLPPDDEDDEWPAVFVIQAPDQDDAKEWGDRLAAQRALDTSEILIRSWTSPCLSGSVDERLLSSSTAGP
jgi:hypothetical protein